MAASGVRSSWETLLRNSDFSSSSSRRRACESASCRFVASSSAVRARTLASSSAAERSRRVYRRAFWIAMAA